MIQPGSKTINLLIFLGAAALVYWLVVPYVKSLLLHRDTQKRYADIPHSGIPWKTLAVTDDNNAIYFMEFGSGETTTLILAAMHGDEQVGFHLALRLADSLQMNPAAISQKVLIVPVANPDGLLKRERFNSNHIDINRNFPTRNWTPVYSENRYYPGTQSASELETQSLILLIDRYKPDKIISIHDDLKMNNYDGPAKELAEKMAESNGYEVTSDVGYETPGSLGTWAGQEQGIAVVTLELPKTTPQKAWQKNGQALIDAINF